jgi:phage tail sheath gpL-like
VNELEQEIAALGLGTHTGSLDVQLNPASAHGVLALSAAAGAVGGTIGGKAVTVAASGGDTSTAAAIAAAINADTTANKFVSASQGAASQTVTISGGAGQVAIAIVTPPDVYQNTSRNGPKAYAVTWATSDAATAAALAAVINADGSSPVFATSSAGVVTLYARSNSANCNLVQVAASGTGVTAGGTSLTGGSTNANVLITGVVPGSMGAGITLAASGTGVTAPTGANLVAGVGITGANTFTC